METESYSDVIVMAGLVENEELEHPEEMRGDPNAEDPTSVVMEIPPPNILGVMLDSVKKTWSTFTRDTKRALIAIVGLAIVLTIVVIATVSRSASIKEPRSDTIWEEIRLPKTVVPSHYDVKLKIDMTNDRFYGEEDVYVDIKNATAVLLVHINDVYKEGLGYEMNVTSYAVARLNDQGEVESSFKVKHSFPYSKNSFYVLKMKDELTAGSYRLHFQWESRLVRGLEGIYISTYTKDGQEKKVLASQMEPLAARKVMPCFDEPDFKANFTMEITAENDYPLVLWNMPVREKTAVEDGWTKFKFGTSVKMSTYLLAFIVADFKCTEVYTTNNGCKVRTCGRPDAIDAGAGDYSAEKSRDIIQHYEAFYGTDFPLKKMDSVAVPDFSAGAMENWGLILYRETALLYDDEKDTYNNKARVNTVIAHELAHQWFGNLVTMEWWNDLWLNEGFASYVEWIGTTKSEPTWNYLDFQTYSDKSRAYSIDSYMSSRPTSIDVSKPDDITAQFDSISYSKGSALLVQAKMFMDGTRSEPKTENFENAIRKYVETHQYNNAIQEDLYKKLHEVYSENRASVVGDMNIVEVMNTWTLQMNFPVVSVRRYSDELIVLSQRRFLISDSDTSGDKSSPYGYQWYVPVEYQISDGDVQFAWLKPHSTHLIHFNYSDPNAFIRLNIESAGYYVVDYDYDLTERLRTAIKGSLDLSVPEVQGMLYDTFLLISAGIKPMSDGLALIDLVQEKEDRLVPLKEISRQINGVKLHIAEKEDLAKEWKKKYYPMAEKLWEAHGKQYFKKDATAQEPLPDGFQERLKAIFSVELACGYGVEDCVEAASSKFASYVNDDTALLADFRRTILNTVMSRNVTEYPETIQDWEFIWQKFLSSKSASEQQVLYYSLGLIQDEATLFKFSNLCMDPKLVRPSDALYILGRSITQTRLGRQVSWKFMKSNWTRITEEFTDALFAVDAYIEGVLSSFADEDTLKQITDFFSSRLESLGPGRASYESAIQSIKGNIAWLEKHESAVEDSLPPKPDPDDGDDDGGDDNGDDKDNEGDE